MRRDGHLARANRFRILLGVDRASVDVERASLDRPLPHPVLKPAPDAAVHPWSNLRGHVRQKEAFRHRILAPAHVGRGRHVAAGVATSLVVLELRPRTGLEVRVRTEVVTARKRLDRLLACQVLGNPIGGLALGVVGERVAGAAEEIPLVARDAVARVLGTVVERPRERGKLRGKEEKDTGGSPERTLHSDSLRGFGCERTATVNSKAVRLEPTSSVRIGSDLRTSALGQKRPLDDPPIKVNWPPCGPSFPSEFELLRYMLIRINMDCYRAWQN